MSAFDVSSIQSAGLQSSGLRGSATAVANSLVPKRHAAASLGDTAAAGATAKTAPATQTTSTGSSTITSNDFLTLLVSELKNQDPTQPTDPNAYISQLVGVNSLQQLISINQGISTLDGTTTTTTKP